MTKLRSVVPPLFAASLVAGTAITLAWPAPSTAPASSTAQVNPPPKAEPAVQAFMALGNSATGAPVTKNTPSNKLNAECIPCGQKGTEPVAGRVPSKRSTPLMDGEYERITGRRQQFMLPSESGTVSLSPERPQRGWLMIITGTPVRQSNAYVEIDADHLRVSRLSGALHLPAKNYSLTAPPSEPDVRLLVESAAVFRQVCEHRATSWAREQLIGGLTVVSVSAREIYAIPTGVTWTAEAPHDVLIRLSPTGRITQVEHVRAQGQASTLNASRVVWFPDYDRQ